MSEIRVQTPGLLTTVQDLGREGFGPLGISPSGAADPISLRIGNRLVGNVEAAAALEMTLLGGTFAFPQGAVLALTGSDFGATLDEAPVPLWASCLARPGQVLRVGPTRSGARCYLCVHGGIAVPLFLGSAATHLLSGLGGHEGRGLRKGDVLQIGPAKTPFRKRTLSPHARERLSPRKILRVTPGPQHGWFSDAARGAFLSSSYRVAEESNRMGLRLEGPPISSASAGDTSTNDGNTGEMISEGVPLGAVQITAAGLPIILFVEQQTTGGYAKLANVISADFHSLGQLRPRDEIRFEQIAWDTARSLLIEQEELLASADLILES
jgi:antagonist of KipI